MKCSAAALLFLALTLGVGATPAPTEETEFPVERAVMVLSQTLANAEQIEIYEGLPQDPAVAAKLKQTNSCRQISGQWFYSIPDDLRMKHASKLQRLVMTGLFQRRREGKKCEFHADYAIAVAFPKVTIYVLFCFGCHEAMLIREANPFAADLNVPDFHVTMDISDKTFEELRSLLTGYHNPEREGVGSGG